MFIISLTYKVDIAQIEAYLDAHKSIYKSNMMLAISSHLAAKSREQGSYSGTV